MLRIPMDTVCGSAGCVAGRQWVPQARMKAQSWFGAWWFVTKECLIIASNNLNQRRPLEM